MLACEHLSAVFLWCLVACEMRVAVSQNVAVVGWGPAVNPLCQCVSNVRPSCESPCLALGAALRRLLNISIYLSVGRFGCIMCNIFTDRQAAIDLHNSYRQKHLSIERAIPTKSFITRLDTHFAGIGFVDSFFAAKHHIDTYV